MSVMKINTPNVRQLWTGVLGIRLLEKEESGLETCNKNYNRQILPGNHRSCCTGPVQMLLTVN